MEKKYNIVYKTTNLSNGMFYVGAHGTSKLDDGYLGTGWKLVDAIKEYGKENFKRETIHNFKTYREARLKESEIVNLEFVNDPKTYNVSVAHKNYHDPKEKAGIYKFLKYLSEYKNGKEVNISEHLSR